MRQKVQALRAAIARYPKPPQLDAALKDALALMDEMATSVEALQSRVTDLEAVRNQAVAAINEANLLGAGARAEIVKLMPRIERLEARRRSLDLIIEEYRPLSLELVNHFEQSTDPHSVAVAELLKAVFRGVDHAAG